MDLRILFLLFMIYAFLGYIIETLVVAIDTGRFTARGFLVGPYLPIFGIGAILITLLLSKYSHDIFVLFVMSCVLGATLEYVSSYILEKIFNTRWWSYENDRFNLNGRICLSATICFGFLGLIVIMFLNPLFISMLNNLSVFALNIITIIVALIFTVDVILSYSIISKIKSVNFGKGKDTTEEVSKKVREILKKQSILSKRLVNAFPDLKIRNKFRK